MIIISIIFDSDLSLSFKKMKIHCRYLFSLIHVAAILSAVTWLLQSRTPVSFQVSHLISIMRISVLQASICVPNAMKSMRRFEKRSFHSFYNIIFKSY